MPNHVTNILTLNGHSDEIAKCFEAIKGTYEDGEKMLIDFNKIIPRPESLNITSGTSVEQAVAIIKNDQLFFFKMMEYSWVKNEGITSVEALIERLKSKLTEEDYREGQMAIDNQKKYGYTDWYNWSIAKWGTKWNAYDQSKTTPESIQFDTAWSTPFPVMCKLSEMFPELTVEVYYADEDIGSNCGSYTLQAGALMHEYTPERGYEATKFAYKVKGYDEIEDDSDVIMKSFGWIKKEELPNLKDDLVDFLKKSDVQTQKNYIDALLSRMDDYDIEEEKRKEKYIFLLTTFLENEFYEVAQHLTERTKVTQEE